MLKTIFITCTIFALSLYANTTNEVPEQQTTIQIMDKCDKVYDDCSVACEESNSNNDKCYAQCEAKYDECVEKNIIENRFVPKEN